MTAAIGKRRELPTGTVTFLFTDIEGSTKLLAELGPESYDQALAKHRSLVRTAFAKRGGVEVDTQGDAFFVAFADASAAASAAREAQQALAAGRVKVRMGLHTGHPHVGAEGYVGHDVHLGARIAAAGHGGQVLVSRATRLELEGDADVLDLGEHRLKDFTEPVWIYQLGSGPFPPLKTISNTNLPRPASSFVGRQREVDEVTALLRDGARLLTLTGPGGTGKTRLAIESASELIPSFRNGVFWVPLAPLREPSLVIPSIAQTVGASDGLAEYISDREMLLLLDNFEQVVDAAVDVDELLASCRNLSILVTSREILRLRGEVEYSVPPLTETEAVDLFTRRSGLGADSTIAELCRRLDNLPLAVELAAARTSVLSPAQILERLAKRLDLLKGGRDAEARQQTLRATIEWSHDLLNDDEKTLFARLSVFRSGCTLEAAESVADADLDVLQSLVDKSLVRHAGERFWMLETIREFAAERLRQSGDVDQVGERHAAYFLALAEDAELVLLRDDTNGWEPRLEAELDNTRAAFDHLFRLGDGERAQRLAGALPEFWCAKSHVLEGRKLAETALALPSPTIARAKALLAASHMARDSGDAGVGRARAEEALALFTESGDRWHTAYSRFWLGANLADADEFAGARSLFEEAASEFVALGDEEYALLARRFTAWMHDSLGERQAARALHERNLARIRELGLRQLEATTLGALASYAIDEKRVDDSLAFATQALAAYQRLGSTPGIATELCRCAGALAVAGRASAAVQLLASAERIHEELGQPILPYLAAENAAAVKRIRESVDAETFAREWELGRTLSPEQAVALAIENAS